VVASSDEDEGSGAEHKSASDSDSDWMYLIHFWTDTCARVVREDFSVLLKMQCDEDWMIQY
jgi:hypothetical protein